MTAIDLPHLDHCTFGDSALRAEVLALFVAQLGAALAALESAPDSDAWRAAAHRLKGSARGIGAWRLGDLCQDAETINLEGDAAAAARRRVFSAIQAEADAVDGAIARLAA